MESGKIFKGILAGFAAGAAIGILFASDKGIATRKKISDKRDKYTEDLKAKYEELSNLSRDTYASAKESVMGFAADGKDAIDLVKDEADYFSKKARKAAKHNYNSQA